jgi:hypothetical protein
LASRNLNPVGAYSRRESTLDGLFSSRRVTMLQNVWRDVRYGFRGLVTRPGFTLIVDPLVALRTE